MHVLQILEILNILHLLLVVIFIFLSMFYFLLLLMGIYLQFMFLLLVLLLTLMVILLFLSLQMRLFILQLIKVSLCDFILLSLYFRLIHLINIAHLSSFQASFCLSILVFVRLLLLVFSLLLISNLDSSSHQVHYFFNRIIPETLEQQLELSVTLKVNELKGLLFSYLNDFYLLC